MNKKVLNSLITEFENGLAPKPFESIVDGEDLELWVRLRIDPKRFAPAIFDGDWAHTQQHPGPGKIRIIKAITGNDGISRLIARQGIYVYAYPWFK